MALDSMQEIFDKIQAGRKPFWQVVRDTDVEERQVTAEASFEKMHATWRAMVESVDTYRADRRSVSGLVGGDAQRMWDYAAQQETLSRRSSPRPCAWRSPTPACTGSWRHPRRGPAACCRLCWCRCTAGAL